MMLKLLEWRFFRSQLARFLSVGAFNTLLGYAVIFAAMYGLKLSAETSNMLGYGVGLVASFVLSKRFTFRSDASTWPELMKFLAVFLIAYGTNYLALTLCLHGLKLHAALSQVVAGACYIAMSYWLNSQYVFNSPRMQNHD
jgi:putative flippase GtrA